MREGEVEDYRAIEAYLRRIEEERRRFVEEQEERRRRAIEFLKEHTFVIGKCDGEDEIEVMRFNGILHKLGEIYGVNFYAVPWDGRVLAIPSEVGANVTINVRELLKHAKRFGENLDFFCAGVDEE